MCPEGFQREEAERLMHGEGNIFPAFLHFSLPILSVSVMVLQETDGKAQQSTVIANTMEEEPPSGLVLEGCDHGQLCSVKRQGKD